MAKRRDDKKPPKKKGVIETVVDSFIGNVVAGAKVGSDTKKKADEAVRRAKRNYNATKQGLKNSTIGQGLSIFGNVSGTKKKNK